MLYLFYIVYVHVRALTQKCFAMRSFISIKLTYNKLSICDILFHISIFVFFAVGEVLRQFVVLDIFVLLVVSTYTLLSVKSIITSASLTRVRIERKILEQ